jgi:glucose/arabinose dehydrogenase
MIALRLPPGKAPCQKGSSGVQAGTAEAPLNRHLLLLAACALLACSCRAQDAPAPRPAAAALDSPIQREATAVEPAFAITEVASFDEPWALAFLPDGRLLVTEKRGKLKLVQPGGAIAEVSGVPAVAYGGQGGLGDVALHPKFAENGLVYLSYAEAGSGDERGAVVARARLGLDAQGGGALSALQVVWRQSPKIDSGGHFGHRLLFGADGKLWISSGERQQFTPAQDMATNLGKIVRLEDDGSVPADNPFAARGGLAAQVWSLGHRNPLGMDFDAQGRLWEIEMGPQGGDELNLIERGRNYGWPLVSNGDNYDGTPIPDHDTAPQFEAPRLSWNPVIAPGDMIVYQGEVFPEWKGNVLVAGLKSEALVRIALDGTHAREVARYAMGKRIREVAQGPAGDVWLLEDGDGGRLLRLGQAAARP